MIKWFLVVILISFSASAQVAQQRQEIVFAGRNEAPVARAFVDVPNFNANECNPAVAAGAQVPYFGISLSGTNHNEFCERIKLIFVAKKLGHDDVADDLFYQFPMIIALNKLEEKEVCDYPTKCTRLGR